MADPERLKLYRYLAAPEADDYVAIMSVFTDALIAERSPQDVAEHVDPPVETIVARCRYSRIRATCCSAARGAGHFNR